MPCTCWSLNVAFDLFAPISRQLANKLEKFSKVLSKDEEVQRPQKSSTRRLSAFEQLPNELLISILDHMIDYDKKHLASVSKRFRKAIPYPPFDTIRICVSTPQQLKEDVASIIEMIRTCSSLQFRRLEMQGRETWVDYVPMSYYNSIVSAPGNQNPGGPPPNLRSYETQSHRRPTILRHQNNTELEYEVDVCDWQRLHNSTHFYPPRRVYHSSHFHPPRRVPSTRSGNIKRHSKLYNSEHQKEWKPAAELILQMSHLEDLVFHCHASFPRPLLDALHEFAPQCRLHLPNFAFRRFKEAPDGLSAVIHENEVALATSPCLHSIRCYVGDSNENHSNAILLMVAGKAPNLKEVTFFSWESREPKVPLQPHQARIIQLMRSQRRQPRRNVPRAARKVVLSDETLIKKPWSGPLTIIHAPTTKCGSLTKLCLHGRGHTAREDLEAWALRTDFSKLRVLHLHAPLTASALHWAMEKQPFKSLDGLWVKADLMSDQLKPGSYLPPHMHRFLQSLPLLKRVWWDYWPIYPGIQGKDIPILSHFFDSIEELCFPGVSSEVERALILEVLHEHGIKPKRLLAPLIVRPSRYPIPGAPWPEYIMANLEDLLHDFGAW